MPAGRPILPLYKTASSAPLQSVLDAFLIPETARLSSSDSRMQSLGRAALEGGAVVTGNQPSPQYLDAYSRAVNDRLVPVMKNPEVKVRLNAAIAAARIAGQQNNGVQLTPTILAAINDKSEAVAIWGVKAAKPLLPRLLDAKDKRADEVAKAVIAAVGRFPQSAAIAEDAYDAFARDTMTGGPANALPATRLGIIPHVLALLNARAAMYQKAGQAAGGATPVFPGSVFADQTGMVFLSAHGWKPATPEQRQQIAQVVLGLVKTWVEVCGPLPPRNPGAAPTEEVTKDDLIDNVTSAASALSVMGGTPLKPATRAVQDIKPVMDVSEMTPKIETLEKDMRAAGMLPGGPTPIDPAAAVQTKGQTKGK
jgi:hypothetical protein